MERKLILGASRAQIASGKFYSGKNGSSGSTALLNCTTPQRKLKRNSDHLTTRGPPAKVHLGINGQMERSNAFHSESTLTLRKRNYNLHSSTNDLEHNDINQTGQGKLPKMQIEDDVEEMRKKFEQWDSDDYKENVDTTVVEAKKGPRVWHIEAYIEQNVYDDDATS